MSTIIPRRQWELKKFSHEENKEGANPLIGQIAKKGNDDLFDHWYKSFVKRFSIYWLTWTKRLVYSLISLFP